MNVKRIKAKTSREALVLARQMLGDEAVILSNRSIPGGVEIMAMAEDELREVAEPAPIATTASFAEPVARPRERVQPAPAKSQSASQPVALRDFAEVLHEADRPLTGIAAYRSNSAEESRKDRPAPGVLRGQKARKESVPSPRDAMRPQPPTVVVPPAVVESAATPAMPEPVARELASLRALVEIQLSDLSMQGLATRAPERMAVMGELLNSGFSPLLARRVAEKFPVNLEGRDARDWVQAALVRNLRCARADQDPVAIGGVYALVGPTGVGKTTTIAKLAARALVRHGASQVALISADNYRIGARDQLDWYGRMLGIPVRLVRDQNELRAALTAFADRKLVLIDTAGMSQRDAHVPEQIALLDAEGVKRIVLLNAGAQAETLDDVVRVYLPEAELANAMAIVTKLDESVKPGGVVDCAIRRQLNLLFITNGQRVPEDMHPAHGRYLVDKALRHSQSPAFARQAEEHRLQLSGALKPPQKAVPRQTVNDMATGAVHA